MATKQRADALADLKGSPLVRRAKYLEKRLESGVIPGRSFDVQEYLALIWVFEKAGIAFTPGVSVETLSPEHKETRLEEPPVRSNADGSQTYVVPCEPPGRRYVGRGL